MTEMFSTMAISSHGMRAQGSRVRVIAENLANKDTGPTRPGEDPYIRQVITFENEMDKNIGSKIVKVKDVEKVDKEQFVFFHLKQSIFLFLLSTTNLRVDDSI